MIAIKAINVQTGKELTFGSIKEAANSLDLQACNISRVLNGIQNRKQHKGWIFKKVDK